MSASDRARVEIGQLLEVKGETGEHGVAAIRCPANSAGLVADEVFDEVLVLGVSSACISLVQIAIEYRPNQVGKLEGNLAEGIALQEGREERLGMQINGQRIIWRSMAEESLRTNAIERRKGRPSGDELTLNVKTCDISGTAIQADEVT